MSWRKSKKFVGEVIKVEYKLVFFGKQAVTLFTIESDDGSIIRAGLYNNYYKLNVGDLVEVVLSGDAIANIGDTDSRYELRKKDGTVEFHNKRIHWYKLKSYKKLPPPAVEESYWEGDFDDPEEF